jgi:formylglycine-generating enzyme required for sulfatase activity
LEWEYAARGGDPANEAEWKYLYAGTTDELGDYAWFVENTFDRGESDKDYGVHPVGLKKPNGAGLYDMSGNVSEWNWDWYRPIPASTGTPLTGPPLPAESNHSRMVTGGNWRGFKWECFITYRCYIDPMDGDSTTGFRIASN